MAQADEILVSVTQVHIDKGIRSCSNGCPIALALTGGGATWVNVGVYAVDVDGDMWELPPVGVRFVMDFDRHRPVVPAAFVIRRM